MVTLFWIIKFNSNSYFMNILRCISIYDQNKNLICPKVILNLIFHNIPFNLILTAGENDRVENRTPADDWPKPSWMMIIKFCHTPALYPFYIMSIVSPTVWYTFCPTVISILFVHWDKWLENRAVCRDVVFTNGIRNFP